MDVMTAGGATTKLGIEVSAEVKTEGGGFYHDSGSKGWHVMKCKSCAHQLADLDSSATRNNQVTMTTSMLMHPSLLEHKECIENLLQSSCSQCCEAKRSRTMMQTFKKNTSSKG